jgi:hypothetical protein
MALKLPRSAERAYITTYGIPAIYVPRCHLVRRWSAPRAIC